MRNTRLVVALPTLVAIGLGVWLLPDWRHDDTHEEPSGMILNESFNYPQAALVVTNSPEGRAALESFVADPLFAKGIVFGDSAWADDAMNQLALVETVFAAFRRARCTARIEAQQLIDANRLGQLADGDAVLLVDKAGHIAWSAKLEQQMNCATLLVQVARMQ